jgi:hypothetical protein
LLAGAMMNFHHDEFQLARSYSQNHAFELLAPAQVHQIKTRGRNLHAWFRSHSLIHVVISISVILSIFAADWFGFVNLARWILSSHHGMPALILTAIFVGVAHSWLLYTLAVYSLHEGAAHNLIFPGSGPVSRVASFLAENLCRLSNAEPHPYSETHISHHASFGTERDAEFLNFVFPHRLGAMLLPLASFFNYSDFYVHRSPSFTRSTALSLAISAAYTLCYLSLLYKLFGLLFPIIVFLLLPHVGFQLDRLRQYTEHNLMPLDSTSGARSLGVGFWGLLVGGGPWGQPCHMAHHMVPSIPWYQQILLHRSIVRLLTPDQHKQFLLRPFIGFPLLLFTLIRDANRLARTAPARLSLTSE